MTDKTFTELLISANETLAHALGKRNLYMTTLPFPRESVKGDAARERRIGTELHLERTRGC
jgi:hypothetical protein